MPFTENIFGTAYLDPDEFRTLADFFGVGMAFCDYPDDEDGNKKLTAVLAAASRAVDAKCGRNFLSTPFNETHQLDLTTWQFQVNNPPVSSISSVVIRYAIDGTITIDPTKVYINNQKKYLEITRVLDGAIHIIDLIGTEINEPQVEITYVSLATVPNHVKLAAGYQAAHMINSGFVDKSLPPNFGKIDIGGLSVNNKKGYRSSEEMQAGSFSADAERLLMQEIRFVAA